MTKHNLPIQRYLCAGGDHNNDDEEDDHDVDKAETQQAL